MLTFHRGTIYPRICHNSIQILSRTFHNLSKTLSTPKPTWHRKVDKDRNRPDEGVYVDYTGLTGFNIGSETQGSRDANAKKLAYKALLDEQAQYAQFLKQQVI